MNTEIILETMQEIDRFKRISINTSGAFKLFLPISKKARALVKDNNSGAVSIAISPHVSEVVCLCEKIEEVNIIKKRIATQEKCNIENIHIILGRIDNLPFKANTFDIICLHGMKQISVNGEIDIEAIHNLLSYNGIFCISFEKIIGSKKWNLKIKIERMIKRFGFKKIAFLQYYNSFSNPHFVRIFDLSNSLNFFMLYEYIKDRFKGENCGIVFKKNGEGEKDNINNRTIIDRIKVEIEKRIDFRLKKGKVIWVGSTGSLIADLGKVIVRLPQTNKAESYCANNMNMLTILNNIKTSIKVPVPLLNGEVAGQAYYVESKIDGVSLDTYRVESEYVDLVIEQAFQFLIDPCMIVGAIDSRIFEQLVTNPFIKLMNRMRGDDGLILKEAYHKIKERIFKYSLPTVICHGDFKFSNFVICSKKGLRLFGIIDWELSSMPGLAMYDLFTLIIWNKMSQNDGFRIVQRYWDLVNTDNINPLLLNYLEKMHIDSNLIKSLALISMVTYLNKTFSFEVKEKECWYREMLTESLIPTCKQFLSLSE